MKSFRPVLLVAVLPAVLLWFAPATQGILLYDRAAILEGAWWRLWTGHWMHFSISHLTWNLVALIGAGAWLEHLQPGRLSRYLLLAAPLISVVFLVGEPAMHAYGGLSGLATGAVVLLGLTGFAQRDGDRTGWGTVLALVMLKLTFDATHPAPLFSGFETEAVQPSALAHVAGAATAVVFFLSRQARFPLSLSRAARPASPPSVVS